MSQRSRIVAAVFIGLGVAGFLLNTSFFSNISELALIGGAFALIAGLAGSAGALVGNPSTGKSIGFGILFSVLATALLVLFFQIIWPLL